MTESTVLPVLLALVSAMGFAVSTSVQHQAAGSVAATGPVLLLRLAQHPAWCAGAAVGFCAWLLHAVALSLGELAIVQPLMLSTVVFALVVRAALDRAVPSRVEMGATVVTLGSLTLFLAMCPVVPGSGPPDPVVAALAAALSMAATAALLVRSAVRADSVPASWLAMASGWTFATTAAFLKLSGGVIADGGPLALLTAWSTYVLIGCGLLGVMANQQSYRAGRLAETMPMLNVVTALGAFTLGMLVFGEHVSSSPWQVATAALALGGVFAGLRRLGVRTSAEVSA